MGNSSSLLNNYATSSGGTPLDHTSSTYCNWTITEGTKRDESKELKDRDKVSIFKSPKFSNASIPTVSKTFAIKHIQRLRHIRHPFILTYYDSAEMDDCQVVITEQAIPLSVWLNNSKLQVGENSASDRTQELIWGFRCILMALEFLHNNCNLLHGNISLNSIFVSVSGDWKLGGMELASNLSQDEDAEYFIANQHLLNKLFCSPERLQINAQTGLSDVNTSILRAKLPPYYIDIYSLGHSLQTAFYTLDVELPKTLSRYLTPMVSADMKKRPTCAKLLTGSVFRSDQVQLLESIDELSIKTSKDALDAITKLEPSISQIASSICSNKVVPSVGRILSGAVTDFANRDLRENCRQSVVTCVNLLSKMASLQKLDETVFSLHCGNSIVTLFSLSDRSVRTVLLQSLRHLGKLLSKEAVNKSIFDHMISGFSDSNSTLRENTLMGLLHIVDKLDENNLQDKLVRCVVNLQGDSEPSIRTNTTIFLGKVASRLKEAVRNKVLCNCFSKAMKDNFLHCRLAGLKASATCIKMMDLPQLTTKILPQAAILVLDKSPEVRSLSISLLEACTDNLKLYHQLLLEKDKDKVKDKDNNNNNQSGTDPNSVSNPEGKDGQGWGGTWSVLQGISKTIETATLIDNNNNQSGPAAPQSPSTPVMVYNPDKSALRKAAARRDDWENELEGLGLEDDDNGASGKTIDEELEEDKIGGGGVSNSSSVEDVRREMELEKREEEVPGVRKMKGWEEF